MISAAKDEIIKAYYPGYFMQSVDGQIQTRQAQIKYDDSYRGKTVLPALCTWLAGIGGRGLRCKCDWMKPRYSIRAI